MFIEMKLQLSTDRDRLDQYRHQFKRWSLSKEDSRLLSTSRSESFSLQAAATVRDRTIIPKEQPQENQDGESSDTHPGETSGTIVRNTESDDAKQRLDLRDLNSDVKKVLKTAADLFLVLGCFEDAYNLYKLIWSLPDKASRLTSKTFEIMLDILPAHLSFLSDDDRYDAAMKLYTSLPNEPGKDVDGEVVQFLKVMVEVQIRKLRAIVSRDWVYQPLHAIQEWPVERVIAGLLQSDRSLQFLVYRCQLSFLSMFKVCVQRDIEIPKYFDECAKIWQRLDRPDGKLQQGMLCVCKKIVPQLRRSFIQLTPGPFELEEGTLKNGCLRSCLEWCEAKFHSEQHSTTKTKWQPARIDEHTVRPYLIIFLWENWQMDIDLVPSLQSEERLGLSAASFLEAAIDMVFKQVALPTGLDFFLWQSVCLDVDHSLRTILSWPDSKLAYAFLESIGPYTLTRSHVNHAGVIKEKIIEIRNCVRSLIEEYARSPNTESLCLPQTETIQQIPMHYQLRSIPASHTNISPIRSRLLVSLMPSISSSNSSMAPIRKLRDRIREGKYRLSPSSRTTDTSIEEQLSQMSDKLSIMGLSPLEEPTSQANETVPVTTSMSVPMMISGSTSVPTPPTREVADAMDTDPDLAVQVDDIEDLTIDSIVESWEW